MHSPEHGYFSAEKFLVLAPVALASLRQAHAAVSFLGGGVEKNLELWYFNFLH